MVGPLRVAYDDDGIWASTLTESEEAFRERCAEQTGLVPEPDVKPPKALVASIKRRLSANEPLPLHLETRTPFQRAVLEAVFAIPRGEVRSYGEIALEIGHPGAARAVGEVMRTNRIAVLIPCHRVVRSGGDIGRYTPDPAIKRRLLVEEGAL